MGVVRPSGRGLAQITATDLVAGVPAVGLAVVAVVSLALAHLHRHSLAAVVAGTLVVVNAVALLALRAHRARRIRIRADRGGVAAVLVSAAVAGALFAPGFSFGVADTDAGGYVSHAVEIARTGSYSFIDPVLTKPHLEVAPASPGALLPGIWIRNSATGLIVPQFFHLWPALLATSYDIAGFGGLTQTEPLVVLLAVMVLVALLRRLVGVPGALIGGLLIGTNMLEVWQAKFPTSEGFAQLLFLTALLGVVVAIQTRRVAPAVVGGLMIGTSFLNRADGWLLVMGAFGLVAVMVALRAADRRALGFTIGLVAFLPYAAWAAYSASAPYTKANSVPSLTKTVGLLGVLVLGTCVWRYGAKGWSTHIRGFFGRRAVQLSIGAVVCLAAIGLLLLGFMRQHLFGITYGNFNGRVARTYDEAILPRLSWFITPLGFVMMSIGLVTAMLRKWRTEVWVALIPILVVFPIFAYQSRNSTRLMWWTRRYVPVVLPGIVILIAIALALALSSRGRGRWLLRIPAIAVVVGLLGVFLHQSVPVRRHCEWCGSFGLVQRISALSGTQQGIYLWEQSPRDNPSFTGFATAVWLQRDQLSVLLPPRPEWDAGYIMHYRAAFAGQPIFVVTSGSAPPPVTATSLLTPVARFRGTFYNWIQTDTMRPNGVMPVPYDMAIYRVSGT